MRLFLIRHGESVDNVAGLYAGSRDSPLTSHGVLQTRRLGAHLAARSAAIGPIRHVFSSDLQRAALTAQAIVDACVPTEAGSSARQPPLAVVQVPELREKDFRSAEGTKYGLRDSMPHTDAETHSEMDVRIERFIEAYFDPTLQEIVQTSESMTGCVVIVAHGIILNVLLRALLTRYAAADVSDLAKRTLGGPEYMASWSNTGYLEADVQWISERKARPITLAVGVVNCVEHLQGLKKTRGGIGSAQFDNKQKTVDAFFKPKVKKQT